MTDAEVDKFLSNHKRLRLATISENRWPHVVPVSYTRLDDSTTLYTHTHPDQRKTKNISYSNKVGAVIDDGDAYRELRGVFIHGRATLVEDYDTMKELEESWKMKLHGGERSNLMKQIHALRDAWIWLRIEPEHVVTWDNSKLDPDRLPPLEDESDADFNYELPDDIPTSSG